MNRAFECSLVALMGSPLGEEICAKDPLCWGYGPMEELS
jgi:hypothetical protein